MTERTSPSPWRSASSRCRRARRRARDRRRDRLGEPEGRAPGGPAGAPGRQAQPVGRPGRARLDRGQLADAPLQDSRRPPAASRRSRRTCRPPARNAMPPRPGSPRIEVRLNERAAEVFMEGPASDVGFYLGATSLSDLSDRIEFVDVVQQEDADLAQEVAEPPERAARRRGTARGAAVRSTSPSCGGRGAAGAGGGRRSSSSRRCSPTCRTRSPGREADEKEAEKAYQRWLASQSYGGHSSVPLPAGWQGVFEACPVDQPRGFGDGFGAPALRRGVPPAQGRRHRGADGHADPGDVRRRRERRDQQLRRHGRVRARASTDRPTTRT